MTASVLQLFGGEGGLPVIVQSCLQRNHEQLEQVLRALYSISFAQKGCEVL